MVFVRVGVCMWVCVCLQGSLRSWMMPFKRGRGRSASNLQTTSSNLQTTCSNLQTTSSNLQTTCSNLQTTCSHLQTTSINIQPANRRPNPTLFRTSPCRGHLPASQHLPCILLSYCSPGHHTLLLAPPKSHLKHCHLTYFIPTHCKPRY